MDNVSKKLVLSKQESINEIANFFQDKTILVQQTGLQGVLYQFSTFL